MKQIILIGLLIVLFAHPILAAQEFHGHGNYSAWGEQAVLEFYGDGIVTAEGVQMKLCLRHGTILNMSGKWFFEDDCMETRKGRITIEADGLDFAVHAVETHLFGSAMFVAYASGDWKLKKE